LAVVALAVAVPVEEKKPEEKKKDEKKPEERGGLQWPMPDPDSEGDLMLHGAEIYDRVDELHKTKVEDEADKSILAHGREYLRRVAKWFDDNADMKIMPVLCRDSRTLNGTVNRWRMEIVKEEPQASSPAPAAVKQRDQPLPKDEKDEKEKKDKKPEDESVKIESPKANITNENETLANSTTPLSIVQNDSPIAQNDVLPPAKTTERPVERPDSNSTEANSTEPADRPKEDSYEIRRRDFYRQTGTNFVRLIQKQQRKDSSLKQDENEYLARWLSDEAVHYGAMAIYCNEGENVKEIRKQLTILLEDKQ
jgi:hypothetical protein